MADTEKKERAPAKTAAVKGATLQQKFIELRKAIPAIVRSHDNTELDYRYASISDIYRLLTPAMNEQGVNFEVIAEEASKHDQNGDGKYITNYTQSTSKGDQIVWVYEADLTLRWTNAENAKDFADVKLHAIGANSGGPDKAKGSAWTYCIKYYLFEKFGIDQGTEDPDAANNRATPQRAPQERTVPQSSAGSNYTPPQAQTPQSSQEARTGAFRPLSDAQLNRLYRKAEPAGINAQQVDAEIFQRYGQNDPHNLTRQQYDEICGYMDNLARQGGTNNA